ncbi:hypothetical protein ZHAS_00008185 [Anopheles sinensis]|uniref:Uncharacterized protein n=1 Tax=Anopheles sinensis TaxID=74873 RepID=A0A084VS13_ANOSI|nr:hypothetical protein ZHAS_00008185 [Anopheles sinensis]
MPKGKPSLRPHSGKFKLAEEEAPPFDLCREKMFRTVITPTKKAGLADVGLRTQRKRDRVRDRHSKVFAVVK